MAEETYNTIVEVLDVKIQTLEAACASHDVEEDAYMRAKSRLHALQEAKEVVQNAFDECEDLDVSAPSQEPHNNP